MRWLTPRRWRGVEVLDDPATSADVRLASMRDVERSNRLFGGARAVRSAFARVLPALPRNATLLDVGCGMGDIAAHLRQHAARSGVSLTCIGADLSETLLRASRDRLEARVVSDATALPFRDASVDLVICSQLLHHFEFADARRVLAELHRVARRVVIVADLRRSWFAAAGFWISAVALRWHPVTRRDGLTSVRRGFTAGELDDLVAAASGRRATIRRGVFWRVTATWSR